MNKNTINFIERKMQNHLTNAQMRALHEVLITCNDHDSESKELSNEKILELFLSAKRIEGCSERTIKYYNSTLIKMFNTIDKSYDEIETSDLRTYLSNYEGNKKASKITMDNLRRIISSLFAWLETEDYILKSPMKRIHKIKCPLTVKEAFSDEQLEKMRDNCDNLRDLAIIDFLASTGIRVGELVNLNIKDIDFLNRKCIVFGKGAKERPVYFDARTKIHLQKYLTSRNDSNEALFVTLDLPHDRLKIRGVEERLSQLGKKLNIEKVHPHRFRRTLATKAISKGMPIEQVKVLLGHSQIDTTLRYAIVDQNNVQNGYALHLG